MKRLKPLKPQDEGRCLPVVRLRRPRLGLRAIEPGIGPRDRAIFQSLAGVSIVDVAHWECDPSSEPWHRLVHVLAPWFDGILVGSSPAPWKLSADEILGVPVFSEVVDGTAVVACAAALRGLQVVGKASADAQFVIRGAGPAGVASAELLCALGIDSSQILIVDRSGVIHADRRPLDGPARSFALKTSRRTLQQAVVGADVFVGLSPVAGLTSNMLRLMAPRPIIVALADATFGTWMGPTGLAGDEEQHAHATIQRLHQATGLVVLPGLIRGAIDVKAAFVDDAMRVAAVRSLVALARPDHIRPKSVRFTDHSRPVLLPSLMDPGVVPAVASAVAAAALRVGAARRCPTFDVTGYTAALRRSLTTDYPLTVE